MTDSYGALIKTTTATTGTLDYVLATTALTTSHRTSKQAVTDGSLSDGDIVQYMVRDTTVTGDASFELGEGVYTDATNEIARDAANVHDGSNGPGALTVWPGSGTRDVYLVVSPSAKGARLDRANIFTESQSLTLSGASTAVNMSLDSDRSGAGNPVAQLIGLWDGNTIGVIRFVGGDDDVNKDEGDIAFFTSDAGASTEKMRITQEGDVGFGIVDPVTNLHLQENNTDTVPALEIEQLSTGDAALQFSIVGRSYAMGTDNSDVSDAFKISTATSAGAAVLGVNDRFTMHPAGDVALPGDQSFIVGAPAIVNSSVGIELNSTTRAILNARMTTTQRDALTAVNGMQIYNTTTNQMEGRINGAWAAM